MKIDLTGQRALVTGGTRGIGRAIVSTLASCGAHVTAVGTDQTQLDLLRQSASISTRRIDLADRADLKDNSKDLACQRFDILVNCAGINILAPIGSMDLDAFDRVLAVNLRSAVVLCNALVPGMAANRYGRIVNLTSVFSHVTKAGRANYATSKFALHGFTKTLALDHASTGVLANCVAPGFIRTELTSRILGEDGIREMVSGVPLGRLGEPEEIAALVAFLASPLNTFVTGQNIIADGGFTSA